MEKLSYLIYTLYDACASGAGLEKFFESVDSYKHFTKIELIEILSKNEFLVNDFKKFMVDIIQEYDEKIKTFFSILEGEKKLQNNKIFFEEILPQCFSQYKFWKLMSQTQYESYNEILQTMNVVVEFDRDNSDYIYNRTDLQNLPGKDFHKKKNLVNAFLKNSNISIKNLDTTNTKDAFRILQIWSENRNLKQTDYYQCIDALNDISQNNSILSGIIVYVEEKPVAWSIGEFLPDEKTYLVHFEKGDSNYKGVYQFINNATVKNLPESVLFINREQDLGDEGMRQAKLTYRPCGFINKYLAFKK